VLQRRHFGERLHAGELQRRHLSRQSATHRSALPPRTAAADKRAARSWQNVQLWTCELRSSNAHLRRTAWVPPTPEVYQRSSSLHGFWRWRGAEHGTSHA
jgi:hypothetical protein